MGWATAISVGGSLAGGLMGSGDDGANDARRDAADAGTKAAYAVQNASSNARADSAGYIDAGNEANQLLAQYLGIDTSGYRKKPTRAEVAAEVRDQHFQTYGEDYGGGSNMGGIEMQVDAIYKQRLSEWEKGLEKWKSNNKDKMGDGRLLKDFTNEDFVKDPGYDFRMSEGNKGIDRAFSSRGGTNSGAALKAIARFNQDYASNEFGAAYDRDANNKNRIYSFLSNTANTGLNASTNVNSMAMNAANIAGQAGINATNQGNMYAMNSLQNKNETRANAIQSAIGNYIYGTERAKDRPILSSGGGATPPIMPQYGTSAYWGGR